MSVLEFLSCSGNISSPVHPLAEKSEQKRKACLCMYLQCGSHVCTCMHASHYLYMHLLRGLFS